MSEVDHFWAVVPAGGAGTRLWPLSRSASPKYLLDLTGGGRTLIQQTADRLAPLAGDRMLVVTGTTHRDAVAGQLPDLDADAIVAEPSPRDSMAAIGLAAALVERRDPDAVIGSFAADHVIADARPFHEAVRRAAAAAADGWLVTIGITPTSPATGFGYVEVGDRLEAHEGVHRAVEFVEKPDAERAREYVAGGRHRWNAGMFVARPGVLLDLLAEQDPAFAGRLRAIAAEPTRLAELWEELPRIAIDHAVAEPAAAAGRVAVVPAHLAWDDLGDFDSLTEFKQRDSSELAIIDGRGRVLAHAAAGLVLPGSGRPVVVIGLEDVVVVDVEDALLVMHRSFAQSLGAIIDAASEGLNLPR